MEKGNEPRKNHPTMVSFIRESSSVLFLILGRSFPYGAPASYYKALKEEP